MGIGEAKLMSGTTISTRSINNGVYRAGFATTQEAYEEAYDALFEALDKVDAHLSEHRYLAGNEITEADWRLFTTLDSIRCRVCRSF